MRPICVGQKVTITGCHSDKYQKRAQNYRILDGEVVDEAPGERFGPDARERRSNDLEILRLKAALPAREGLSRRAFTG